MALRPVYSSQLLCVAPALPSQFVTCPDGVVMVIRDIDATEISGTNGAILVFFNPAGGEFWACQRTTATPLGLFQWRGRQVLVGGQSFEVQVSSGTWSVWVSGYELTAP